MSHLNIDTAKTTVVSDSGCFLQRIILGGGTTGAITLYNDTYANPAKKLLVMAPEQGSEDKLQTYEFQIQLEALTIVTAAATDLLVIYLRLDLDG